MLFLILVNRSQPLALVIRNSILDLAGLLDPPLLNTITSFCSDYVINLFINYSYALFYMHFFIFIFYILYFIFFFQGTLN